MLSLLGEQRESAVMSSSIEQDSSLSVEELEPLDVVELVELCPVSDGFFMEALLPDSSLLRPGRTLTAKGLKLVVKFGMKSRTE